MNKIVKLMSLFIVSCSFQVFGMELVSHDNDSIHSYTTQNDFLTGFFYSRFINPANNNLFYNVPQDKAVHDQKIKPWYNFIKHSFHLLKEMNADGRISKIFFNTSDNDKDLIASIKGMVPENTGISDFINNCYYDCEDGLSWDYRLQCIDDIIHNNVYAVVLDTLIKEINLKYNDKVLLTNKNDTNYRSNVGQIIENLCKSIKNPTRKHIIETALLNYYEHNRPDNLTQYNFEGYCVNMSGLQNDIFNEPYYSNHILCSGLSPSALLQIFYSTQSPGIGISKYIIEKVEQFISQGYITHPEIKKCFGIYNKIKEFEKISFEILNNTQFLYQILEEYGDNGNHLTEVKKQLGNSLLASIAEELLHYNQWDNTYDICNLLDIKPWLANIIDENINKIRHTSKQYKEICKNKH